MPGKLGRMHALEIDLNADLGEGHGQWRLTDDEALLGIVTSANIACGAHAGDALFADETMPSNASSSVRRHCP